MHYFSMINCLEDYCVTKISNNLMCNFKYFENYKRKDDLLNMIEIFKTKDEEKNIV